MKLSCRFLLSAMLFCTVVLPVSAHYAGQVLEVRDGELLSEIGVDTTDILPGRETLFRATLFQNADALGWNFMPYDTLLIRVVDADGRAVFEHTFPAHNDPQTYFAITFPRAGLYNLRITYQHDAVPLLEGSVPLTVSRFFTLDGLNWILLYALIAGAYVALVLRSLHSRVVA